MAIQIDQTPSNVAVANRVDANGHQRAEEARPARGSAVVETQLQQESHIVPAVLRNQLRWRKAVPLAQVALLALAANIQWSFPVYAYWAALPLAISLLLILISPRVVDPKQDSSACSYHATQLCLNRQTQWIWMAMLFAIGPLALVIGGVIPWYFGVYAALSAICALSAVTCLSRPGSVPRPKQQADAAAQPSPRITACWLNLLTLVVLYAVLISWQYIDSHGISATEGMARIVATVERAFNGTNMFGPFGSLSLGGCGNSYATSTRGELVALRGNSVEPRCLLLSSEQLHLFLLVLLLCGSVARSLFLLPERRLQSVFCDVLAVAATAILFVLAAWWDVLSEKTEPILWPYRGWTMLCVAALWLAIRSLLAEFAEADVPLRGALRFQLPQFRSVPTVLCGLLLVAGFLQMWHEPGTQKPGRILIDETHSDWERADLPMETEFYGVKTVYNYGYLKEILGKHYPSVETNRQPLTPELLSNCDVLILKTPTSEYQPEEVQSVKQFVENGGGLWLIGDHTNIFGMTTYLNQIGSNWGIRFIPDAVVPVKDYFQQLVQVANVPPVPECGERKHEDLYSAKYLNHPIIGHNIPYLAVLTSCSISAPLTSEYVSISRGTFCDSALFGGNTFFGNMELDPDERYGCILQSVALKSGRGRVAVWSDSTMFSNFAMCMTGVPQLALGSVNWLNRSNSIAASAYHAIELAVVLAIAAVILLGRKRPADLVYGTLAAAIFLGFMVPVVDGVNSSAYAIEDARQGFSTIGFDQQYSHLDLPNKDHVHQNGERYVYESLYVMMQRLHLVPVSNDRLSDLLSNNAIVITNPLRDIDEQDVTRLHDFMKEGGSLVLMLGRESPRRAQAAVFAMRFNRLLEHLKVGDRFETMPEMVVSDLYGQLTGPVILTDIDILNSVKPGDENCKPILKCAEGDPVAAAREYGKGKLILCSVADIFSNASIGEPSTVPDSRQAMILRTLMRFVGEAVKWNEDQKQFREPWERLLAEPPARLAPQQSNTPEG